jgi:hypothetical protein
MGKPLSELGTYQYKIQFDGLVLKSGQKIKLRRMADKERDRFIRKKARLLADLTDGFRHKILSKSVGSSDVERLHEEAMRLGQVLSNRKGLSRIAELDDTANQLDLVSFIDHIVRTEMFLENGMEAPEQVDLLNINVDDIPDDELDGVHEEAEGLGEAGQPSESQATTAATDSPAETSSSTAEEDTPSTESPG